MKINKDDVFGLVLGVLLITLTFLSTKGIFL